MANIQVSINKETLRKLHGRLNQNEAISGILPHLPGLTTYRFSSSTRYGRTLQIQMGPHMGKPVYVSAEGKAIGFIKNNRMVSIESEDSWDDLFVAPGVFGWTGLMLKGIREPFDPRVLAMIRYLCLQKIVKDGTEVKAIAPDFKDLMNCIWHLHNHSAFISSRDNVEREFDAASISEGYSFSDEDMPQSPASESAAGSRQLSRVVKPAAIFEIDAEKMTLAGADIQDSGLTRSSTGVTQQSGPTKSKSMASIKTKNILTQVRGFTDVAPILRSQMKPEEIHALSGGYRRQASVLESSDEETTTKKKFADVTPAGPEALSFLRQKIAPHLLSRLPPLPALTFEEHGKGIKYARVRLLIGKYGEKHVQRWGEEVWAYAVPGAHARLNPKIYTEVSERLGDGRHENRAVTWDDDIATNRIVLEDFAKKASSKNTLVTLIKYCFLIATEGKMFGHERHFIPIHRTFINQLTAVCEQWDSQMTDTEPSVFEYTDDEKMPEPYLGQFKRLQKRHSLVQAGVAQIQQSNDSGDDAPFVVEEEDTETEDKYRQKVSKSKKMPKTKDKGMYGVPRARDHSSHHGLGVSRTTARPTSKSSKQKFALISKSSTLSPRKSLSARSPVSGHAQRTEKTRQTRRKDRASTTPRNSIEDRRPPAKARDTVANKAYTWKLLRDQKKVISGRVEKNLKIRQTHWANLTEMIERDRQEKRKIDMQMDLEGSGRDREDSYEWGDDDSDGSFSD